jgi:energy-converting hydrogenase B subunit D
VTALQVVALAAVAVGGTAVVFAHDPLRQALVVGVYGFMLAVVFFIFQAPDVGLSEIVVSTVAIPMMILLAVAKIREHERDEEGE